MDVQNHLVSKRCITHFISEPLGVQALHYALHFRTTWCPSAALRTSFQNHLVSKRCITHFISEPLGVQALHYALHFRTTWCPSAALHTSFQNHLVSKRCITHFISEPLGVQALHYALHFRTTWCPSAALRTSFRFMMGTNKSPSRYDALGIRRGGTVPGPSPQRGPPSATGGHLTSSCLARRRGARVRATDRNERPTPRSTNIL